MHTDEVLQRHAMEPDDGDVARMTCIIDRMSGYEPAEVTGAAHNGIIPSWVAAALDSVPYGWACMQDFLINGEDCDTLHAVGRFIIGIVTRMHDDGMDDVSGPAVLDSLFDAVGHPSDGVLPDPYTVTDVELASTALVSIPYGPERIVDGIMRARRKEFEHRERSRFSGMGIYGEDLDAMLRFSQDMGGWAQYLPPDGKGAIIIDGTTVEPAVKAGSSTLSDIDHRVFDRLVHDTSMCLTMAYLSRSGPRAGRSAMDGELSKLMSGYVESGDVDGMVFILALSGMMKETRDRDMVVDVPIADMDTDIMEHLICDLLHASPEFAMEDVKGRLGYGG